jgi:hypothetical protein
MLQIHERQYNHAFHKKASRFVFWKKDLGNNTKKPQTPCLFAANQKPEAFA